MCEWRDVRGFEGFYVVNDLGQIKSTDRIVQSGSKSVHRKGKLRSPNVRASGKYQAVRLSKNGKTETRSVHRIVAEAFLPNPDGLPEVNHKDKNPLNNRVDNLEWCTRQENIEYSKNKPIKQTLNGKLIATFKSITDASRQTGILRSTINNALSGRSKSAGGFVWEYMIGMEG